MPRNPNSGLPLLSLRALNRATLARQSLLERSAATSLAMIRHLTGMQAQAPLAPYFGLWSRVEQFTPENLSALLLDRSVVRIALMRGTVHLVTAEVAHILRPLMQPFLNRLLRQNTQFSAGIEGVDLDELASWGRALVESQPRTMMQLRPFLAERWPDHDPASLAHAIYYLLPHVQIPPRGVWGMSGQPVCTTLDVWTKTPMHPAPSIDEVLLQYLAAYGPASVHDAQVWSGLTRLGEVFTRLRPKLMSFVNEDGVELFDLPDAPRPDEETPSPVRILAPFDNVLISYKDRRRVLPEHYRRLIFTQNGLVKSAVLVDGFVVGFAAITRVRSSATLTIELFEPVSRRDREEIAAEGQRPLGLRRTRCQVPRDHLHRRPIITAFPFCRDLAFHHLSSRIEQPHRAVAPERSRGISFGGRRTKRFLDKWSLEMTKSLAPMLYERETFALLSFQQLRRSKAGSRAEEVPGMVGSMTYLIICATRTRMQYFCRLQCRALSRACPGGTGVETAEWQASTRGTPGLLW